MYDFILEDIHKDLNRYNKVNPWKPFIYIAAVGGLIACLSFRWQLWLLLAAALVAAYFFYVRPKLEDEAWPEPTVDHLIISVDECVGVKCDAGTDGSRDYNYVTFRNAGTIELPETSWAPFSIKTINEFCVGEKYYVVFLTAPWPNRKYFYHAPEAKMEDATEDTSEGTE